MPERWSQGAAPAKPQQDLTSRSISTDSCTFHASLEGTQTRHSNADYGADLGVGEGRARLSAKLELGD